MNGQWPRERMAENREIGTNSQFKNEQDFLDIWKVFNNGLNPNFDKAVTWIIEQDGSVADLERIITPIIDAGSLQAYPDSTDLVMTLTCAAALAHAPSLEVWVKVNAFKYNSWQIEHWLAEAMMAYTEINSSARDAYIQLAKEIFLALDNFSLQSKSDRKNEERSGVWAYWSQRQDKLEEIWWGLRGWSGFMNYEEDLSLLEVFYKLNPGEFISTVSGSANPYLVSASLFVAGIGAFYPRFSEWQRMIAAAPIAFMGDGKWGGSVLIPLLLVDARNQLLQLWQGPHGVDLTPEELDDVRQEIASIAENIVTTIAARQDDATVIFIRWAPWLMRNILGQTEREIVDVKSSAFYDNALIEAIGRKLVNCELPQKAPDDAPLWEAWCYRCVLASFAHDGHIQTPEWQTFRDEWSLSPEDWAGKKGRNLRERARLIVSLSKEIPGVAANLLAYPIARSPSAVDSWISLWNDANVLREIMEFGDSDAVEDEYRSRSEAGQLLFLLFNIGLAIFDQISADSCDSNSREARSLANLFKILYFAANEMREVDRTFDHDKWLTVMQHLAVRRMIWEPFDGNENASKNYRIFIADDIPTVSDILIKENSNVMEMAAILQSLLLNVGYSRLKDEISSASIDVCGIVQMMRALNQYHQRKYPIDEEQLKRLEALI